MNVAKTHQVKIAKSTLKMSIVGASIMGGMTHAEAYEIIFRQPLKDRLELLISEYPNAITPRSVFTELDDYGWETVNDWKELLAAC